MNRITYVSIALLITFFFSAKVLGGETIISANELIYTSFQKWVEVTPCEKISNFSSPYANRGTIELVLICQALDVAGYKTQLKLQKYPNYKRSLTQAKYGKVHIPAETLWEIDIDDKYFYKTDPIIKNGEFEKGIYTLSTNTHVLKAHSLKDLQSLTSAIPQIWRVDWATLQDMKINTAPTSNKINMFKMVKNKRIDFTLLEFSYADDLSNTFNDIQLVPVPNIKIGLQGKRSFVVSKQAPNSKALYQALNRGIKILRESGVISKALRESGFINERVKSWKKVF